MSELPQEALDKAAEMLDLGTEAPEAPEASETEEAQEASETSEPAEAEAAETPAEEEAEKPEPAEEPKVSQQLEKIAQREREFRKREIEFKRHAEELSQRMKDLEARENKLNNPSTLFDILDGMGMTVEQFGRHLLEGNIPVEKPKVDPVAQEQEQLKRELAELKEFREQMAAQQRQAELDQYVNAYKGEIKAAVPQFENLTEWFGDSMEEIVDEAVQAAELYAEEYEEAPEVSEILSQLDRYYGSKLEKIRSKYKPAEEPKPKKEPKPAGKTLSHNHTRSIAADTKGDDVFSRLGKEDTRELMQNRALELFKKHGQLL